MFVVDGLGNGAEVDVAERAIRLLQILKALAERVALNQSPSLIANVARRALVLLMDVTGKGDAAETVARAFFDGHQDVDALAPLGRKVKE